jgi:hypothetical protein
MREPCLNLCPLPRNVRCLVPALSAQLRPTKYAKREGVSKWHTSTFPPEATSEHQAPRLAQII